MAGGNLSINTVSILPFAVKAWQCHCIQAAPSIRLGFTCAVWIPAPFSLRREKKTAVQRFLSVVAVDQLTWERGRCSEEGERILVQNRTHLQIRCIPMEDYVPAIRTTLPRKQTRFLCNMDCGCNAHMWTRPVEKNIFSNVLQIGCGVSCIQLAYVWTQP